MFPDPKAAPAGPPQAPSAPPSPTRQALLQRLEQLRAQFHRQLDALEALAKTRAPAGPQDLVERERRAQQQLAQAQRIEARLVGEREKWERERQAALEQLDHDRRLLADAWERLEAEQAKAPAPAAPAAAPRVEVGTAATPFQPAAWPVALAMAGGRDEPVTEEILRQFQSLRRDVRRNTEAGCST